jgi:hypothetical protein
MKLSEAIRLGSMLAPQGFGFYKDAFGASCTIGAAMDAGYDFSQKKARVITSCPLGCSYAADESLIIVLAHLNDRHRWTREAIADWVQQAIERPQSVPVAAAVIR